MLREKFLKIAFLDFTFPNSYNLPTFLGQFICYGFISLFIALYFLFPVFCIVRRGNISAIVTMPKTSVCEKRNTLLGKDKIRMSYEPIISAPAHYMLRFEHLNQLNFC